MFSKHLALHLDIDQLNFIKQQTGFYPHEMIGKTITVSTYDRKFTGAFLIESVGTSRYFEDDKEELGWCIDINLRSNVLRSWCIEHSMFELLVQSLSLYIRRESIHNCDLTIVKRNVQTNEIEVVAQNMGSYAIK